MPLCQFSRSVLQESESRSMTATGSNPASCSPSASPPPPRIAQWFPSGWLLAFSYPRIKRGLKCARYSRWVTQRMLPHTNHPPAMFFQEASDNSVTLPVPKDFRAPERFPSFGHPAMPSAAVPETPVHEDRDSCFAEGEIWTPQQTRVAAPAIDARSAEDGCKP